MAQGEERVLNLPRTSETKTWDPMVGYGAGSDMITFNIYEALISIKLQENETWTFEPLLATSWDIAENHSAITFQLREDVLFHDGTPFNSSAVEFWFNRMVGVNRGPAWLYGSYIDRVEPQGPYQVTIHLNNPTPEFDIKCIMSNVFGAYAMVSPTYVMEHATEEDPWAEEWMYDHTAGTGPYILESVDHGVESTWVRFPDYWGGWAGDHIDRVNFKVIEDPQVQLMQFLSGEIDTYSPSYDQIQNIQNEKPDAMVHVDQDFLAELYIFQNMEREPLKDINVRKAISYGFDYQSVVEEVYEGYARQGRGPLPHAIPSWDPNVFHYNYDLELAQEYLANSSYPDGFSATIVPSPGLWEQVAQVFQSNMADLGIDVEIQAMPYSVLWDVMNEPETAPEFTIALWYPDYPTADSYITPVWGPLETSWQNWAFYENPRVNELLEEGRFEFNETRRTEIYHEIQSILVEDAPSIYMLEEDRVTLLQPYVEGYERVPNHQAFSIYKMNVEGKYAEEPTEPEEPGQGLGGSTIYILGAVVIVIALVVILYQRR
jgi:peptide/nickel transport system substrate-binding protein